MTKTCSGAAYQVSSLSSCLQASIPARSVNVTIKIDNEGYVASTLSPCLQATIPARIVNVTIKIDNEGDVAEGVPSLLPAIIPAHNVNISIKLNRFPTPTIAPVIDVLEKNSSTIKEVLLPVATPSPTFSTPKTTARMPLRCHQMKDLPAPASLVLAPTPRKDLLGIPERGSIDATMFNDVQIMYIRTHIPNIFDEILDFSRASDTFIYECLCSNGIFTNDKKCNKAQNPIPYSYKSTAIRLRSFFRMGNNQQKEIFKEEEEGGGYVHDTQPPTAMHCFGMHKYTVSQNVENPVITELGYDAFVRYGMTEKANALKCEGGNVPYWADGLGRG